MNKNILLFLIIYYFTVNLISALISIIDKRRAIRNKWRISEASLMLLGLLGGAFGEYFAMKIIHHKTKHIKFMVGLPAEMILHIAIITLLIYKVALI